MLNWRIRILIFVKRHRLVTIDTLSPSTICTSSLFLPHHVQCTVYTHQVWIQLHFFPVFCHTLYSVHSSGLNSAALLPSFATPCIVYTHQVLTPCKYGPSIKCSPAGGGGPLPITSYMRSTLSFMWSTASFMPSAPTYMRSTPSYKRSTPSSMRLTPLYMRSTPSYMRLKTLLYAINIYAGRYDNPIPTRFLAPIYCYKIPALLKA